MEKVLEKLLFSNFCTRHPETRDLRRIRERLAGTRDFFLMRPHLVHAPSVICGELARKFLNANRIRPPMQHAKIA